MDRNILKPHFLSVVTFLLTRPRKMISVVLQDPTVCPCTLCGEESKILAP